jgi:2,3-bisphosphoglycerate-independent phosphoglycerate mutase
VWDATVRAVETLDSCLARVVAAAMAADASGSAGAVLCVTADHGNAEEMRDPHGAPVTAHSLAPVPVLLAGRAAAGADLADGVLADVAPTLLELAGVPPWEGMTGTSLLRRARQD